MSTPLKTLASRRRVLFAGAGSAGALAVLAGALPPTRESASAESGGEAGASDDARGYRLTPHVLRYYRTAKV